MTIIEVNGVEYQVNIAPSVNISVSNTSYPRIVRGDFFVNGQVLDQDGALVSNVASGQTVTVNTGQTLQELWDAASDAERITLFQGLTAQNQLDIYSGLTDAERLALFVGLTSQDQIDLYNGLTDVLRKSLFDQLTAIQKDYIIPLQYNYPEPTGQTTSYATYDDAWQETNVFIALRAAQIKWCRRPRLGADWYTLLDNNIHGNTLRFTLTTGLEPTLATAGQLIQDHYSGLDFITGPTGASYNFTTVLTYADGLSFGGFTDWYVASENTAMTYSPKVFGNKYDSKSIQRTVTTAPVTNTNCLQFSPLLDAQVAGATKASGTVNFLIFRIR